MLIKFYTQASPNICFYESKIGTDPASCIHITTNQEDSMKYLILLSAVLSFNAFAGSDSCPLHQNLIDLNENFELSIKAKIEIKGDINLEVGKSEVYDDSALMTIASHSDNLLIPKDTELPLLFVSDSFAKNESLNIQDRSIQGVFSLGNSLERIDFVINDRSGEIPAVKDLEKVLGDSFSLSCKRRQASNSESTKNQSSSSQQ
jgi:hypothetical protein